MNKAKIMCNIQWRRWKLRNLFYFRPKYVLKGWRFFLQLFFFFMLRGVGARAPPFLPTPLAKRTNSDDKIIILAVF